MNASPQQPNPRETRTAAALRENLRKRKQQAQTRAAQNEEKKDQD